MGFLATRSSGVFERLGLDPKIDYDFRTRLRIQNEILNDAIELYSTSGHSWISDRTPLDMLAYTLADVQRANLSDEDQAGLMAYMARCFRATNMYFSALILVSPGIEIVEEAGKAPGGVAYIEHLNSLMLGLVVDERVESAHFFIPRRMVTMEDRLQCVDAAITRVIRNSMQQLSMAQIH